MPNILGKLQFKIKKTKASPLSVYQPLIGSWVGKLGNNTGIVQNPNYPTGYVYVRDSHGDLITVWNQRVPMQADLWVVYGYDPEEPKLLQVLSQWTIYPTQPLPSIPTHNLTHTWPGNDTVYIRAEQFLPYLVRTSATPGLTVTLYPGYVEGGTTWDYVAYQTINLASYIPATGAIAVLISIDSTGAIVITNGTTATTPELITAANFPATPTGNKAIAAIRLFSGQIAIQQTNTYTDIFDLRFGGKGGGGGGAPSGPAGGDLAGTYPNPTVFQGHLTDQLAPTPPASGTLIFQSFNQQGFSVPHAYDTQGNAVELSRDNIFVVRNVTGSPMTKGQVVYVSGTTGTVPQVTLAKADSKANLGYGHIVVLYENIADNAYGRAMMLGNIEHIDMSAFANGDMLYVSSTVAGGLVNAAPAYPAFAEPVGMVLNNGVGNGVLQVYTRAIVGVGLGDAAAGDLAGTYPNPTLASTVLNRGLHSARPTATGSNHYYFETDTTNLFQDTGAGVWTQIASIGGGAVAGDGIAVSGTTVSQNIDNGTAVTSLADADEIGTWNAIATAFRKITWANFKLAIKAYADTLYIALGGARTVLTSDRTYYVATTGSDSNDGLTSGTPFLTIQHACDVVGGLDVGIYNVTIQIADGTYTLSSVVTLKSYVGTGTVTVQGNATTPDNVILSGQNGFYGSNVAGMFILLNFKMTGTSGGAAIHIEGAPTHIQWSGINFGTGYYYHIWAAVYAFIECVGSYKISGGAGIHQASSSGRIYMLTTATVTITGTPNFTVAFLKTGRLGLWAGYSGVITWSGSATGKRYDVSNNSVIDTLASGATWLPGDAAGTTATGGQYT